MSITEVHAEAVADHAIVYLKTDDGEVHALEWGSEHQAEAKHNHHDKTHAHVEKHSQGKAHDKAESEEHATHGRAYNVHLWTPIGTRPGAATIPSKDWHKSNSGLTPETLNHDLKHEWHKSGAGASSFHDAGSFVNHVLSILKVN